ncbi:MAG: SDR family oxidoreductase [Bacteroidota bacterium]
MSARNLNIAVIGASSDVGEALVYQFAPQARQLWLSSRRPEELVPLRQDLQIRGLAESVELLAVDAAHFDEAQLRPIAEQCDLLILCIGYLSDQQQAEQDFSKSQEIIQSNFTGLVPILNIFANEMEQRKAGGIIAISSVAGERGRSSNYFYGSAKAGLTAFLSGLRNRLFASGVHVLTVIPGFIDTKMTAGLTLPPLLTASAEEVAKATHRAYARRKNVLYVRSIWRWIMLVIRNIPEPLFKRMKL